MLKFEVLHDLVQVLQREGTLFRGQRYYLVELPINLILPGSQSPSYLGSLTCVNYSHYWPKLIRMPVD